MRSFPIDEELRLVEDLGNAVDVGWYMILPCDVKQAIYTSVLVVFDVELDISRVVFELMYNQTEPGRGETRRFTYLNFLFLARQSLDILSTLVLQSWIAFSNSAVTRSPGSF